MRYTTQKGIHIVEVPAKDFKIVMTDKAKKSSPKNSCNAGFFAPYPDCTLPVGHLVCDFGTSDPDTKRYCVERGSFNGTKFSFDNSRWEFDNPLYNKKLSTLVVNNNVASIIDTVTLPYGNYVISGVPIMRSGADVKFIPYVTGQGWSASSLYATWHIFVGLKQSNNTIYVIGMQTSTANMILSAEAFKKFKNLGFRDVIKLDGGGSFYFNANGYTKATAENRRVNTIILFGDPEPAAQKNPYPAPTITLRYLNKNKNFNKWMQWELNRHGFQCSIDGDFGPTTLKQLKAFQASKGLAADGSCGPATRKALAS